MPPRIILVVEDEPLLRMAAIDMVESAGFEAVEAADATQAVEILQSRMDICIVFTDIDMPRGIDGLRLAALIRDRWPPIHVIITSGQHEATTGQLAVGHGVLLKAVLRDRRDRNDDADGCLDS